MSSFLISVGQCGNPRIAASTYIRNGTCSPYGAYPWTVQIQVSFFISSIFKFGLKVILCTLLPSQLHTKPKQCKSSRKGDPISRRLYSEVRWA